MVLPPTTKYTDSTLAIDNKYCPRRMSTLNITRVVCVELMVGDNTIKTRKLKIEIVFIAGTQLEIFVGITFGTWCGLPNISVVIFSNTVQ